MFTSQGKDIYWDGVLLDVRLEGRPSAKKLRAMWPSERKHALLVNYKTPASWVKRANIAFKHAAGVIYDGKLILATDRGVAVIRCAG